MKFSIAFAFALTASTVSAFAPSSNSQSRTASSLQMTPANEWKGYYTNLDERNAQLEGTTLPASKNFDPLGFSDNQSGLFFQREAEIKHARLAMLAAAGWPIAELLDGKLASLFGADPVVDAANRNPSILNGGLGKVSPLYWGAILAFATFVDLYQIQKANSDDATYFPGNLGFDPLGLYPKDKEGQERMQAAEIRNGRLAMISISAFAFQEFVQSSGVTEHSSIFFKPFGF